LIHRPICVVDMPESFSGAPPFAKIREITHVIQKVLNGERPARPEGTQTIGLTDGVWKMVEGCWGQYPRSRLRIFQVVSALQKAAAVFARQKSKQ
jgi:hypothetical protein